MKAGYKKPVIEIEKYELNASVAANCGWVVNVGPGYGDESACEDFEGSWDVEIATFSLKKSFYETVSSGCDCYYSSGGEGYFTS